MQCDIDVIGEESNLAEIELILATTTALANLQFDNVTVRISDRRVLNALADFCGFTDEQRPAVFIALDKLDKIGVVGVMREIEEIAPGKAEFFINLIGGITASDNPFEKCVEALGDYLPVEVKENLTEILYVTNNCVKNAKVVFDVTLVRGMGYYTGTIYEISVDGLSSSVGGGGRYDKMIGKITGTDVCACGFSIGFERIAMLMQERGVVNKRNGCRAVLLPKNLSQKEKLDAMQACNHLRERGPVTVLKRIKNFGYQLHQLKENGFDEIYEFKNGAFEKID